MIEPSTGTVVVRYGRLGHTPADVDVAVSSRPAGRFTARPGPWTFGEWLAAPRGATPFAEMSTARLPFEFVAGRLQLELATAAGEDFALPVDWIRLDGVRWKLPITLAPWPRLLVAGVFLLFLLARGPLIAASMAAVLVAVAQCVWAAHEPLALVHVAARLTGPGLGMGLLVAWAFRGVSRRWILVAIFMAGYLLKGAGLFHPSYYYPDVLSHSRYVAVFRSASGSLYDRGREAQVQARVGLRPIAGRWRPFPYSPAFYLPFTVAAERVTVEEAMKHAALIAAAAEVPLVFVLASLVFGSTAAFWAALLAAFLPILYSRLLLALFPTVVGHAFDTIAIIATMLLLTARSRFRWGAWTAAALLSLLGYVTALFNLGAFLAAGSALSRKMLPLLLAWVALAFVVVTALYAPFLPVLFGEILPSRGPGDAGGGVANVLAAFGRVPIFYGWLYPLLAIGGVLIAHRREQAEGFRLIVAYGLAILALVGLRGLFPRLLQDLKELEFASPFVAVAAGASLAHLASRGPRGTALAAAMGAGLVLWGLWKYAGYLALVVRV